MIRVWTDNSSAGVLDRSRQRGTTFVYEPAVLGDRAVSVTMPVRLASWDTPLGVAPIFEMNLPEGALRERLRLAFAKATGRFDDLDLLAIVGRSQLGRIRFTGADDQLEEGVPFQSVDEILSSRRGGEFYRYLIEKFATSSGISGVQPKFLVRDEGMFAAAQGAKRALSGDTFFVTTFANAANVRQDVAFSSHFPGKILPVDLRDWNGVIIGQKDSFLCAARGINVTIAFTRRIGAGFFGGEGFILQRIEGPDGLVFLHASGTLHEMQLRPGESLRVDTGCIVAMEQTVDYDIQMVPGIKTALFGGEGLFFAQLRGPGRVLLQTMPFSRLADHIIAASRYSGRREERHLGNMGAAGIVGGIIGSMIDSDR